MAVCVSDRATASAEATWIPKAPTREKYYGVTVLIVRDPSPVDANTGLSGELRFQGRLVPTVRSLVLYLHRYKQGSLVSICCLALASRTGKQNSAVLSWGGELRAFVSEVLRFEMLTEIGGSSCTYTGVSFAVITLAVQPRRGEFKTLSATFHCENPYPWQLGNRVWGLPANENAVSKRGGCSADEPHALVSWQRRHVLFCCRQQQELRWQLNVVRKAMHSNGIAAAVQGCEEVVGDRRGG